MPLISIRARKIAAVFKELTTLQKEIDKKTLTATPDQKNSLEIIKEEAKCLYQEFKNSAHETIKIPDQDLNKTLEPFHTQITRIKTLIVDKVSAPVLSSDPAEENYSPIVTIYKYDDQEEIKPPSEEFIKPKENFIDPCKSFIPLSVFNNDRNEYITNINSSLEKIIATRDKIREELVELMSQARLHYQEYVERIRGLQRDALYATGPDLEELTTAVARLKSDMGSFSKPQAQPQTNLLENNVFGRKTQIIKKLRELMQQDSDNDNFDNLDFYTQLWEQVEKAPTIDHIDRLDKTYGLYSLLDLTSAPEISSKNTQIKITETNNLNSLRNNITEKINGLRNQDWVKNNPVHSDALKGYSVRVKSAQTLEQLTHLNNMVTQFSTFKTCEAVLSPKSATQELEEYKEKTIQELNEILQAFRSDEDAQIPDEFIKKIHAALTEESIDMLRTLCAAQMQEMMNSTFLSPNVARP